MSAIGNGIKISSESIKIAVKNTEKSDVSINHKISNDSVKIDVKRDPGFKNSITFKGMQSGAAGGAIFGGMIGLGTTLVIGKGNNLTTMLAIPAIGAASGAILGGISSAVAVHESERTIETAMGTSLILGAIAGAALSKGEVGATVLLGMAGAFIGIGAGIGAQFAQDTK